MTSRKCTHHKTNTFNTPCPVEECEFIAFGEYNAIQRRIKLHMKHSHPDFSYKLFDDFEKGKGFEMNKHCVAEDINKNRAKYNVDRALEAKKQNTLTLKN